jgi:hypothetical protein
MKERIVEYWQGLLAFGRNAAVRFRAFWDILIICRVPFALSVVAIVALTVPDQTSEAFRVLSENAVRRVPNESFPLAQRPPDCGLGHWYIWHLVGLASCTILLALLCWHSARLMTYMHASWAGGPWTLNNISIRWIPRVAGFAIFFAVAGGAWIAADQYTPDFCETEKLRACAAVVCEKHLTVVISIAALVMGVAFLALVIARRRYLGPPKMQPDGYASFKGLFPRSRAILGLAFLVGTALFAMVYFDPWLALNVGSPISILLLSLFSMIPIWVVVSHIGMRNRVPLITLILAFAILFSAADWNDNHVLRHSLVPQDREVYSADFGEDFERWLETRADRDRYSVYPVVLVAAEGGGLRAAYFTAQVLARLQDVCPAFAQHLYAVSGVSGGSVGAAVFAALVHQYGTNAPDADCAIPSTDDLAKATPEERQRQQFLATVSGRILAQDYLTPTIATTLFPDFVQRFWPRPIESFDRALTLERSLERAWEEVRDGKDGHGKVEGMQPNVLGQSFYELGRARASKPVPALFLNTTHVESGNRSVIAPLWGSGDVLRGMDVMVTAAPRHDVALSTAAFASARFPFVSPAAWIERRALPGPEGMKEAPRKMRYVDGGYYDNSGTATLNDLIEGLREVHRRRADSPAVRKPFRLVVVWIGNDPLHDRTHPTDQPLRTPATWLGESMSPIRAVMNARQARSDESVRRVEHVVELLRTANLPDAEDPTQRNAVATFAAGWTEFRLVHRGTPVPLGWLLSDHARLEIESQLAMPARCSHGHPLREVALNHNQCAFGEVVLSLNYGRAQAAQPVSSEKPNYPRLPQASAK